MGNHDFVVQGFKHPAASARRLQFTDGKSKIGISSFSLKTFSDLIP
jgi:hypothetical protein